MTRINRAVAAFGFAVALATAAHASPVYDTASFSGTITSASSTYAATLGIQRTNTCTGCAAGSVFGNLIYDINAEPAGGTGVANNIFLGPVTGATDAQLFTVSIGALPILLHFGDANIQGGPAIQYKADGTFNGVFFDELFTVNSQEFELNMQGNAFTIYAKRGVTRIAAAASGKILTGDSNLTDRALFVPGAPTPAAVPEPTSVALLGLGLIGLMIARRRA